MQSLSHKGMPPEAREALVLLGKRLKQARLRRNESQEMVAQRTGTTRATQQRLEKGHPGTTLGVLMNTLYIYGLLGQFDEVADPDTDAVGKALEMNRAPKRARRKAEEEFNSDF
jgi:transcriptional regulator with XRE-family HTH domain